MFFISLYSWGLGYKLGIGTEENQRSPVLVKYFVDRKELVDRVSCGECHCAAITTTHKLYLWGKSENGCIGDGDAKKHMVLTPFEVTVGAQSDEDGTYPIDVDLGWKTSAIIMSNGDVYSWGCATTKCLGHSNIEKNYVRPKRIQLGAKSNQQNDSKNSENSNSSNSEHKEQDQETNANPKSTSIKMTNISFGSHHAAAVTEDGDVWIWGNNSWGNVGAGNKSAYIRPQLLSRSEHFGNEKVIQISCTKSMLTPVKGPGKEGPHTMAVTDDGSLYSWGAGHKGKCANLLKKWGFHLKGSEDIQRPYRVGGEAHDKKSGDTGYFKDSNIVRCASGAIHSAVLDDEGKCYTDLFVLNFKFTENILFACNSRSIYLSRLLISSFYVIFAPLGGANEATSLCLNYHDFRCRRRR